MSATSRAFKKAAKYFKKNPQKTFAVIVVALLALAIVFPGLLATHDPYVLNVSERLLAPGGGHIFGTDEGGRDIYSRLVYGARYSLGMSVSIVLIAAGVGSLYGIIAGYAGGRVENVMMRIVDLFLSFPYLILAMAIASIIGRGVLSPIISLSLVWWPSFARMVRGQVISIKQNLYVEAARAVGVSEGVILFRHILPHCANEIMERVYVDIGYAILALTGLSFLGLGVQNPSPEWGLMVANAKMYVLKSWWYGVFPGIAIFLSVLSFTLLGQSDKAQIRG